MHAQAAAGIAAGQAFMNAGVFFALVGFRLDREAAITQALSDLAWLYFTLVVPVLLLQDLLVGALVRADTRGHVPTWFGWANWVLPVGWFGAWASFWLKEGPFAWNGGGVAFWFTTGVYLVQIVLNLVCFWVAAGRLSD